MSSALDSVMPADVEVCTGSELDYGKVTSGLGNSETPLQLQMNCCATASDQIWLSSMEATFAAFLIALSFFKGTQQMHANAGTFNAQLCKVVSRPHSAEHSESHVRHVG